MSAQSNNIKYGMQDELDEVGSLDPYEDDPQFEEISE